MKKMKRIIALALAMVMMMAMSITAFADQVTTITGPDITIQNFQPEKTTIKVYELATVNTKTNTVDIATWAKGVIPENSSAELTDSDTLAAIYKAFKTSTNAKLVKDETVEFKETTDLTKNAVKFTGLPAGAYFITASAEGTEYNYMIAVTYDVDEDGNYIAKASLDTINAKGENNIIVKDEKDSLVNYGDKVHFTITEKVPANASTFTVYDKVTNLKDIRNVVVKVVDTNEVISWAAFVQDATDEDLYVMDLDKLVIVNGTPITTYSGKDITIDYDATVDSDYGFINTAYDSRPGSKHTPVEVYGHSGSLTLVKYGENDENGKPKKLENAEFEVALKGADGKLGTALKFVYNRNDNVYELSDAADASAKIKTDKDGYVKVVGLGEGTYHFTETKAPQGYSINTTGVDMEIEDLSDDLKNVKTLSNEQLAKINKSDTLTDTTLIKLPFTGGMGTTIFTVLGVAIMAIAAALFFASKRRASK